MGPSGTLFAYSDYSRLLSRRSAPELTRASLSRSGPKIPFLYRAFLFGYEKKSFRSVGRAVANPNGLSARSAPPVRAAVAARNRSDGPDPERPLPARVEATSPRGLISSVPFFILCFFTPVLSEKGILKGYTVFYTGLFLREYFLRGTRDIFELEKCNKAVNIVALFNLIISSHFTIFSEI